jgi:hypothetical protein
VEIDAHLVDCRGGRQPRPPVAGAQYSR